MTHNWIHFYKLSNILETSDWHTDKEIFISGSYCLCKKATPVKTRGFIFAKDEHEVNQPYVDDESVMPNY